MNFIKSRKCRIALIITISLILLLILLFVIYSYISINVNLIGNKQIVLNYSEKFKEPGYKASVLWYDTSKKVTVKSNLKNDVGTYTVSYNYKFMFFSLSRTRKIIIVDKEKPVITLNEGDLIQLRENEEFKDPGYIAKDNKDGDITKNVSIEGTVDTKKAGEYVIKYKVTDSSGNITEIERKVKVIKNVIVQNKATTTRPNNNSKDYVIIGDSNIKNLYYNKHIGKGKAWAIPCLHAKSMQSTAVNIYGENKSMTVVEAARTYKPSKLVLYFGTFSTAWINESEFDSNAQSIIDQIRAASPGTTIYLLSLLPITQNGPNINQFSQPRIDYFNTKISSMAAANGLRYIDAQSVIKDASGYGNPSYYNGDGYHLNSTGHGVLKNYINGSI